MDVLEILDKKKKGLSLNAEEIEFFINGALKGSIADYQISAFLMAVCCMGMDENETYFLTKAMKYSGETIDLSFVKGITVDKHSTGGVSDTVTLVIMPIIACSGLYMVKMSGRGLSHTGGTIDKLESIKGFNTNLNKEQIQKCVNTCGAAITEQTANLVPADKILYALRDVTATVDSIPLIASSIMSKKLAVGADIIFLDVKYGSGAFMKSADDAVKLARLMVDIGLKDGKKCAAIVSSMQQPLTEFIGCNFEINSAIDVLKGAKNDLYTVSREICARIFILAGKSDDLNSAYQLFDGIISSGRALEKFKEIVICQGGDPFVTDQNLKPAKYEKTVYAQKSGFVSEINAEGAGRAVMKLGGGREYKDQL
jgi:pyrimidine-nucleoside phosphorylase